MKNVMVFGFVLLVLGFAAHGVYNDFEMSQAARLGPPLRTWNLFNGELKTAANVYAVEIDESDHGEGFSRIVHLYPKDRPSYYGITGHDYNADGQWDRIFYCGYSTDGVATGCNSVARQIDGSWLFMPCPADRGKVEPFTASQITFAGGELDAAMVQIHNNAHVTWRWIWDKKEKRSKMVYNANGPLWK